MALGPVFGPLKMGAKGARVGFRACRKANVKSAMSISRTV